MLGWLRNLILPRRRAGDGTDGGRTSGRALSVPIPPMDGSASLSAYKDRLSQLSREVEATMAKAEVMTQIRYKEWKEGQLEERMFYLDLGVTIPATEYDQIQDKTFTFMEECIRRQREKFEEDARRIAEEQSAVSSSQDAEQARLEASRAAAAMIAQSLSGELS